MDHPLSRLRERAGERGFGLADAVHPSPQRSEGITRCAASICTIHATVNWYRAFHNWNSLRTAAAMPAVMSPAMRAPFAAVEPLAEDSTPDGGTHSVRVGYMS